MNDPLLLHLVDLLDAAPNNSVILGGGLGLRIKRAHQITGRIRSLAESVHRELPEARATTDIDLFLRIEIFARQELGLALRRTISELGYWELTPKWQFERDLLGGSTKTSVGQSLVLDLLARKPDHDSGVKTRSSRVGSGSGTNLHGRETIEAFAVEDSPVICNIIDGAKVVGLAQVAHPYAMLNMKVRAAHDWFPYQREPWPLRARQEPPSVDCTLIVAMLTQAELAASKQLAIKWSRASIAGKVKYEAGLLYGKETSAGWIEGRRQGMFNDHALIWGTMKEALGMI